MSADESVVVWENDDKWVPEQWMHGDMGWCCHRYTPGRDDRHVEPTGRDFVPTSIRSRVDDGELSVWVPVAQSGQSRRQEVQRGRLEGPRLRHHFGQFGPVAVATGNDHPETSPLEPGWSGHGGEVCCEHAGSVPTAHSAVVIPAWVWCRNRSD